MEYVKWIITSEYHIKIRLVLSCEVGMLQQHDLIDTFTVRPSNDKIIIINYKIFGHG